MTYGPGNDVDETLEARSFNIASHIEELNDVFAYREPSFRRIGGIPPRAYRTLAHLRRTAASSVRISGVPGGLPGGLLMTEAV